MRANGGHEKGRRIGKRVSEATRTKKGSADKNGMDINGTK